MRVHFQMLGCRLNEAELQAWVRDFTAAGHQVVDAVDEADLLVVNTCAVTSEASRKSRRLIRRTRRRNKDARLVVTGCYGTLERGEAEALPGVDRVVDNRDKHALAGLFVAAPGLARPRSLTVAPPRLGRGRDRAFVKVQDGCRHRCSYCVVTLARGAERSRPVSGLVEEVAALHAAGVNEVVLTGVHVGGYGGDIATSLAELVAALLADTDLPRLRLASLEPWALDDTLLACFSDPRLQPHLHLPLQSGSDAVLRRMARRCRRDTFRERVARVRDAVPDINLTTDIIAGFPGETEADWKQTVSLVEEIAFGDVHVFPFSARDGTRAASLPDPLPAEVCQRRAVEMQALGRHLRRLHLRSQVGRERDVLLEGAPGEGPGGGYTPDYLRVVLDRPLRRGEPGTIRTVRLCALAEDGQALRGRVCS